jgi:hypothetical protein
VRRRGALVLALAGAAFAVAGCNGSLRGLLDELDGDAAEERAVEAEEHRHRRFDERQEETTAEVNVTARVPEDASGPAPGTAKGPPLCFAPAAERKRLATEAWARLCGRAAERKGLKVVAPGTAGCVVVELSATVRERDDDYVKTVYLDVAPGPRRRKIRTRLASEHGLINDETIVASCRAAFSDYPARVDDKAYLAATQLAAETPAPFVPAGPRPPPPWRGPHDSTRWLRAYYDRINTFFKLSPGADRAHSEGQKVSYGTKSDWLVGGAFGVGGLSAAYATTRPRPSGDKGIFGRTRLSAYQLDLSLGHWDATAFHRRFKGFYREANDEERAATLDEVVRMPELSARSTGVIVTYVVSPERVVLPGRTPPGLFPVDFGASFLVGARFIDSRYVNPEPLLPETERHSGGADDDVRGVARRSGGPNFGVAAHVPLGKGHLSVDGSAAVGLELDRTRFIGGGGTRERALLPLLTRLGGRYLLTFGEIGIAGMFDYDSVDRRDLTIAVSRDAIETYVVLWL